MVGADIVQDVEHKGTIAGTELIYGKVMEWITAKLVIGNEIARNSFSVIRSKEFCRRVPKLAGVIKGLLVKLVFKLCVASAQIGTKRFFIRKRIEIEGRPGRKYGDFPGKVAIVRIVETIYIFLSVIE